MPSLKSTLTSTLTVLVTVSSATPGYTPGYKPGDTPGNDATLSAIRGLSDCAQSILFPCLANSLCNPADFPCVCAELDHHGAKGLIAAACTASEVDQYNTFQSHHCSHGYVPNVPPAYNVTYKPSPPIVPPYQTGVPYVPTVTDAPYNNATVTHPPAVVIPTPGPKDEPTPITAHPAPPAAPAPPAGSEAPVPPESPAGSPAPEPPAFTGAAAAVDVPEFGKGRMGLAAAGMAFMGLVFAEL